MRLARTTSSAAVSSLWRPTRPGRAAGCHPRPRAGPPRRRPPRPRLGAHSAGRASRTSIPIRSSSHARSSTSAPASSCSTANASSSAGLIHPRSSPAATSARRRRSRTARRVRPLSTCSAARSLRGHRGPPVDRPAPTSSPRSPMFCRSIVPLWPRTAAGAWTASTAPRCHRPLGKAFAPDDSCGLSRYPVSQSAALPRHARLKAM